MAYLSNVNAIPEMTSDTAPSGGASASSTQNQAWIAFSNANDWRTANGQTAGWIRYDFTRKIVISKYSIKPIQARVEQVQILKTGHLKVLTIIQTGSF